LNLELKKQGSSIAKEEEHLENFYKQKMRRDYDNYREYSTDSIIYLCIFKRVENSVREQYRHKRKISSLISYNETIQNEFEPRVGTIIDSLISEYSSNIPDPNKKTQIFLNDKNITRWKAELSEIKDSFSKQDLNSFVEKIKHLEIVNIKNPNLKKILFEASKFIAKHNKQQSLIYYAKYIHFDKKSKRVEQKQLSATIQKSLFNTDDQRNDFKTIIDNLIKSGDINNAIELLSKIYIPKRKKIVLDKDAIKSAEKKHQKTVELLDNVLSTEDYLTEFVPPENNNDLPASNQSVISSIFGNDINLNTIQEELIQAIVSNSFQLSFAKVDKYATRNNLFRNQLIDSINEAFQDKLDGEVLIEEDDEIYIIEESFYNEIAGV